VTESSQDKPTREGHDMSTEEFLEIRRLLTEGKGELVVNQQILFKHVDALPPARRIGMLIAGWGPIVLFPVAPILYFAVNWKIALFTVFLSIFWVGMGRKYAQAAIRRQCFEDRVFLTHALAAGVVKIIK